MGTANDKQVAGTHYRGAVQHWDYAAEQFGPGYFWGQVTKYLVRWRRKNGIQDLEKALHFLDKLQEIDWDALGWATRPWNRGRASRAPQTVGDLAVAWQLPYDEGLCLLACTDRDVPVARQLLLRILDRAHREATDPQPKGYVDQD